jgi:hypothetical protein
VSRVFVAYPSRPELRREAVSAAAEKIGRLGDVTVRPWEDLHVGGRIVIDVILREIETTDGGLYELTDLNPNVLFELGYAVGKKKSVFPVINNAVEHAVAHWQETRILDAVGYVGYTNSDDIFAAFTQERPDLRQQSVFDESIAPTLRPAGTPSVFYISSLHTDDASGAITRIVRDEASRGIRLAIADPRETGVQPLTWYAQQIYDAVAALIHFESPENRDAWLHNARCAFVGGLAQGMSKPLLMLAPEDYSAPFDYRDLLYVYASANEASTRATHWLNRELDATRIYLAGVAADQRRRDLATELKTLRLGEPVAENEAGDLDAYFVETPFYRDVLAERTGIYVGRRGTGKTATMLEAARQLSVDRRNLVCTITPSDYQIETLARLISDYHERDTRGYVIEAIWVYLLLTEVALAVVRDISSRPAGVQPNAPEWELAAFLEGPGSALKADFDIRLERAIRKLNAVEPQRSVEQERESIVEALYRDEMGEIRRLVEASLVNRSRVAILIDNLDRAWDQRDDLAPLSYLLLGLLNTAPGLTSVWQRAPGPRHALPFTAAVFIRTDIYQQLLTTAIEPDKLPVRRVGWDDPNLLLRVIEERYAASAGDDTDGREIWARYFCEHANGLAVQDYILKRVLPRPRDVIVYVLAAIEAAIVRQSEIVDVEDILKADDVYSQFAFDAIKIEDPELGARLEDAIIEFAGGEAIWNEDDLHELLLSAGFSAEEHDQAINQLRDVSFLGIEVRDDEFNFSDDDQEKRRGNVMARRLSTHRNAPPRYLVHSAFRPYLEIREAGPANVGLGQERLDV